MGLLLNFNIVAVLAVPSLFLVALRQQANPTLMGSLELALVFLLPAYITLAMFFTMAHKEERFLTMTYPLICLGAAVTVDVGGQILERGLALCCGGGAPYSWVPGPRQTLGVPAVLANVALFLAAAASSAVSVSRSTALHLHFGAPMELFEFVHSNGRKLASEGGLCIGKEWYRFPSTFFLPDGVPLLWVNSSFDGQLPRPFGPWPTGLSEVPSDMNDRNRREPSRYVEERECGLLVDLVLKGQSEPEPDAQFWEPVKCMPFLDVEASRLPWRAFYVPGISDRHNTFALYCVWRRRASSTGTTADA